MFLSSEEGLRLNEGTERVPVFLPLLLPPPSLLLHPFFQLHTAASVTATSIVTILLPHMLPHLTPDQLPILPSFLPSPPFPSLPPSLTPSIHASSPPFLPKHISSAKGAQLDFLKSIRYCGLFVRKGAM